MITGRDGWTHPNGELYCQIMEEIKTRIYGARDFQAANIKSQIVNQDLMAEFCILQLRYCCELLALGCIAMHADKPETKRLEKIYKAHEVMEAFEGIKSKFFPQARNEIIRTDGAVEYVPTEGALTKDELVDAYGKSGNYLHIGKLKNFKKKPSVRIFPSEITSFFEKLVKLLNVHHYLLYDEVRMVRVVMDADGLGKVAITQLVPAYLQGNSSGQPPTTPHQ